MTILDPTAVDTSTWGGRHAHDPTAVRGARNLPCPEGSGRGPVPASCRIEFPGGVWQDQSATVAYELATGGAGVPGTPSTGAKAGDDAWEVLVLAPSVGGSKEATDYVKLFDFNVSAVVAALKRTTGK